MNAEWNGGDSHRDAYEVLEIRSDASHVVVQAAFRALAAVYHPDAANGSTRRMAELNAAYAQVRTPDRRAAYDRIRRTTQPAQPQPVTPPAPKRMRTDKGVLDFGRYAGWSIADLAHHNPDYLLWLRRHSSGLRYRQEIDAILAAQQPRASTSARRKR
jgi:curved DNA-binding protein CbpA